MLKNRPKAARKREETFETIVHSKNIVLIFDYALLALGETIMDKKSTFRVLTIQMFLKNKEGNKESVTHKNLTFQNKSYTAFYFKLLDSHMVYQNLYSRAILLEQSNQINNPSF